MTIKLLINLWSSFLVVATSFIRMINLKVFKQSLVKNGITNLSEEQIIKLRDHQDQMAEMLFGMWVDKIKKAETEL